MQIGFIQYIRILLVGIMIVLPTIVSAKEKLLDDETAKTAYSLMNCMQYVTKARAEEVEKEAR